MLLVLTFKTSSSLASAYGIAVTGAMLADTALFFIVARKVWNWKRWQVMALGVPFLCVISSSSEQTA